MVNTLDSAPAMGTSTAYCIDMANDGAYTRAAVVLATEAASAWRQEAIGLMSSGPGLDAEGVRKQAQEAIESARKEAGEAEQAPREDVSDGERLVTGSVEVLVARPVTAALRSQLEDSLRRTAGLRLVTSGGAGSGEIRMIVYAAQPLPLAALLERLPFVTEVTLKTAKKVTQLQVHLAVPG